MCGPTDDDALYERMEEAAKHRSRQVTVSVLDFDSLLDLVDVLRDEKRALLDSQQGGVWLDDEERREVVTALKELSRFAPIAAADKEKRRRALDALGLRDKALALLDSRERET